MLMFIFKTCLDEKQLIRFESFLGSQRRRQTKTRFVFFGEIVLVFPENEKFSWYIYRVNPNLRWVEQGLKKLPPDDDAIHKSVEMKTAAGNFV